ncbi:MAG: hypothetical protein UH083_02380, partial [Ruminococcus sp.]|nr:hypothetical protein [Ruminococcus sp.]
RFTTIGLRERYDVLDWVRYAEQRGAKDILLYGVSMGAAGVAYASPLLGGTRVRAMVMESGFYSIYEQMRRDAYKNNIPRSCCRHSGCWQSCCCASTSKRRRLTRSRRPARRRSFSTARRTRPSSIAGRRRTAKPALRPSGCCSPKTRRIRCVCWSSPKSSKES